MGKKTSQPLWTPDPQERQAVLSHVRYEMEMLIHTWRDLRRVPTTDDDAGEKATRYKTNLLLESCLLHVRSLVSYFEGKRPTAKWRTTDALAEDLMAKPYSVALDQKQRDRLNRELAHITYERTEVADEKAWVTNGVVGPVLTTCEEFLTEATEAGKVKAADENQHWERLLGETRKALAEIAPSQTVQLSTYSAVGTATEALVLPEIAVATHGTFGVPTPDTSDSGHVESTDSVSVFAGSIWDAPDDESK